MKTRKIICLSLVLALILSLAACVDDVPSITEANPTTAATNPSSETIVTDPGTTGPDTTVPAVTDPPGVTQPDDPVEPTQPSDPVEPSQPPQPVDPPEPTQPIDPPTPTEPVHRHSYSKNVTAPTCIEDGYTTYFCGCGDSYVDNVITTDGHNWSDWTNTRIPSEFAMGKDERTCLRCHEHEIQYIPNFNHSYWDDTRTYETGVMEYNFDQIPDYMLDSKILRALEFTGYDLQYLKDQKLLYHPDYIGYALEQNQSTLREKPVLSGIKYSNRGMAGCLSKKATTQKELTATVTGRVPNIPAHLEYGMSCTSFVEYFLLAYLPHCEGVNVSAIESMHAKAASRYANGTYTYPDLWTEIFEGKDGLISQGLVTHYEINVKVSQKHTAEYNEIWRKIQPGTIIRFGNNVFPYIHYAIYVGSYNNLHYVAHVGNDRGPEIVIAESLGAEVSDDPSWPIEFYDLHLESIEKGSIQIVRTDGSSGAKLSGAYFTAVNQLTGKEYLIGPTTEAGYAILHGLPYGTYTVREATAPDGYVPDTTTYTVELSSDNLLVTLNATAASWSSETYSIEETDKSDA